MIKATIAIAIAIAIASAALGMASVADAQDTKAAPTDQQMKAAQQFADTLADAATADKSHAKVKATVTWAGDWKCGVKVGDRDLQLEAAGPDPKRDCVQAMLQLARIKML